MRGWSGSSWQGKQRELDLPSVFGYALGRPHVNAVPQETELHGQPDVQGQSDVADSDRGYKWRVDLG